jgi:hypothetical protein
MMGHNKEEYKKNHTPFLLNETIRQRTEVKTMMYKTLHKKLAKKVVQKFSV